MMSSCRRRRFFGNTAAPQRHQQARAVPVGPQTKKSFIPNNGEFFSLIQLRCAPPTAELTETYLIWRTQPLSVFFFLVLRVILRLSTRAARRLVSSRPAQLAAAALWYRARAAEALRVRNQELVQSVG
jgi:hypothetical protein